MKPLYLFDLDGTLANLEHRLHHISDGNKDWDAFYDACIDDEPIHEVIMLAKSLAGYAEGAEIWIVSGRSDRVMEQTALWLQMHHVPHHALIMRRDGDFRPDHEIKQEMLDNMLDVDRARIEMAFDDRDRVVAMWRANSIRCLQVAPGAF